MLKQVVRFGESININLQLVNNNTKNVDLDVIAEKLVPQIDQSTPININEFETFQFKNPELELNFSFKKKSDEVLDSYINIRGLSVGTYIDSFVQQFRSAGELELNQIVNENLPYSQLIIFSADDIATQYITNSVFLLEYYDTIGSDRKLITNNALYLSAFDNSVDELYVKYVTLDGIVNATVINEEIGELKDTNYVSDSVVNTIPHNINLPRNSNPILYLKISFFNSKLGELVSLFTQADVDGANPENNSYNYIKILLSSDRTYRMFIFNSDTQDYTTEINTIINIFE